MPLELTQRDGGMIAWMVTTALGVREMERTLRLERAHMIQNRHRREIEGAGRRKDHLQSKEK